MRHVAILGRGCADMFTSLLLVRQAEAESLSCHWLYLEAKVWAPRGMLFTACAPCWEQLQSFPGAVLFLNIDGSCQDQRGTSETGVNSFTLRVPERSKG